MVLVITRPESVGHYTGTNNDREIHQINGLDISPDGERCATVGGDYKIKIWKTSLMVEDSRDALLCTISNDTVAECCRWSNDGVFLATGDDCLVKLFAQRPNSALGAGALDTSGANNIENWKCVVTLKGHVSNLTSLAWSPNSGLLASGSMDSTIRIWPIKETYQSRELATVESEAKTVLRGHQGWVKGLDWDPVGRYLASVGDDQAVVVTRCSDWKLETRIEEPFKRSSETTLRRNLSWSPDGVFLCVSHAVDGARHVAYIIERNKWKDYENAVRLVGHPAAISVCSFSPTIYKKGELKSTVVALVCEKLTLSLWSPGRSRPLVVCRNLFEQQILDLRWAQNGHFFIACSMDGRIACIKCDDLDNHPSVGKPLAKPQLEKLIREYYGDEDMRTSEPTVLETPLQYSLERKAKEAAAARSPVIETSFAASRLSSSSSSCSSSGGKLGTAANPNVLKPRKRVQVTQSTSAGFSPSKVVSSPVKEIAKQGSTKLMVAESKSSNAGRIVVLSREDGGKRAQILSCAKVPRQHELFFVDRSTSVKFSIVRTSGREYETLVKLIKNDRVMWQTTLNERVTVASGTEDFVALGTKNNTLYILGRAGQLLLPALQLPYKIACLSCGGKRYLCCTTVDCRLRVWDVQTLTALIWDVPIDPLLIAPPSDDSLVKLVSGVFMSQKLEQYRKKISNSNDNFDDSSSDENEDENEENGNHYNSSSTAHKPNEITDLTITDEGIPLLLMARGSVCKTLGFDNEDDDDLRKQLQVGQTSAAFAYVERLRAWVRLADCEQFVRSEFYSTLCFNGSTIQQLQQDVELAAESVFDNKKRRTSAKTKRAVEVLKKYGKENDLTKTHLESLIGSAVIMGSPTEYKDWVISYANRLSEENDELRVRALCDWLLVGGKANSDEAASVVSMIKSHIGSDAGVLKNEQENVMLNVSKTQLLSDHVLPIVAKNRQLQKVVVEYDSILKSSGKKSVPGHCRQNHEGDGDEDGPSKKKKKISLLDERLAK